MLPSRKQAITPDLKKLIHHLTGTQEGSAAFKKFEDGVWKILLHQEFPYVDRQFVTKKLQEITQKWRLCGLNQKANNLELLVNCLVSLDYFKEKGDQCLPWELVQMLLSLSRKSTASVDDPPIKLPLGRSGADTSFDWPAYLKEGLPDYSRLSSDRSLSDWSDKSRESSECSQIEQSIDKKQESHDISTISSNEELPPITSHGFNEFQAIKHLSLRVEAYEHWLQNNVQYGWWQDPLCRDIPYSKHAFAHCALFCESKLKKQYRIISEYKAIRSILWCLHNPSSPSVVVHLLQGGLFVPTENLTICSVLPVQFKYQIQESLCPLLSILYTLNEFFSTCCYSVEMSVPKTYVAYATALKEVVSNFNSRIRTLDATVAQQEKLYLLTEMFTDLKDWFYIFKFLNGMHKRAMVNEANWIKSARLLATLYDSLLSHTLDEHLKKIILMIFLKTVQPYFDILNEWMCTSTFNDPADEFIITRALHNDLRYFVIRDYKNHCELARNSFIINFSQLAFKCGISEDFLYKFNKVNVGRRTALMIENLYSAYINTVLKSVTLIENNSCDHIDLKSSNNFDSLVPLSELTASNEFTYAMALLLRDEMIVANCSVPEKLDWQADPLIILERMIDPKWLSLNQTTALLWNSAHEVIVQSMRPKGFARDILLKEYKLLDHLKALRSVYLLQSGVISRDFPTYVYKTVESGRCGSMNCTILLRNLLYDELSDLANNFQVTFSVNTLSTHPILNKIMSTHISYNPHNVLSYIISSQVTQEYNLLLQFLLQFKYAVTNVMNLRFKDLKEDACNSTRVRRMYSMRMWLLNTMTSLQHFFLLFDAGDFDEHVVKLCAQARDVHSIAIAHEKALESWKDHCFLTEHHPCKHIIQNLIHISLKLSKIWNSASKTPDNVIGELENSYISCVKELNAALSTGFKSSYHELLASELSYNIPESW